MVCTKGRGGKQPWKMDRARQRPRVESNNDLITKSLKFSGMHLASPRAKRTAKKKGNYQPCILYTKS